MKKFCRNIMLGSIAGLLLISGTVYGLWRISGRSVNVLTTATFSNRIVEEYKVPEKVDPGQKVEKIVNVQNQGTRDSLIRLKVTRILGNQDDAGKIVKDEQLDSEMIEIQYNTDHWKQLKDGYWYYTDILKAGETTSEPLFESYRLSKQADNRYKNKCGEILVELESIQASSNASEALWGIKESELGVATQACKKCNTVTKVTVNKNSKIVIDTSDADLFANFKNLLPGCARTQKIKLSNQSEKKLELYLKAEQNAQKELTEKERKLVETLLGEYACIEVKQGSEVLYKGAVDGSAGSAGKRLTDGIFLGSFNGGDKKDLTVSLSVSTEMDNAYQNLTGKVDWVFYAVGEDNDPDETKKADGSSSEGETTGETKATNRDISSGKISPVTGDTANFTEAVIFLAVSLLVIALCGRILQIRKKR